MAHDLPHKLSSPIIAQESLPLRAGEAHEKILTSHCHVSKIFWCQGRCPKYPFSPGSQRKNPPMRFKNLVLIASASIVGFVRVPKKVFDNVPVPVKELLRTEDSRRAQSYA